MAQGQLIETQRKMDTVTKNNFNWKVAGAAGDGILNAGLMLARTCQRAGLYVFASAEYPSLIRGGHNHLDVRISDEEIHAHTKNVDLMVAMNKDSIDKHLRKIPPGGGIIYDGEKIKIDNKGLGRDDVHLFNIPLDRLAKEAGHIIMRNVIAMGATIALLDFDLDLFNDELRRNFQRKGEKIVEGNINAARMGYDFAKENFREFGYKLEKVPFDKDRIFMSGNEAISAGAIKAGCKFVSAYPMTPASSVMMTMAKQERNYNLVVKHTEDEIAGVNMAIGASFAGVRAMTATSGGGFCLMTEGLGLAAQTETPLVIVEAQRPGPATGMATHSGQGDLKFVLHASTDESPRIVIAPGDVNECFYRTIDAFNLAEKYQMPVVILTDKFLGESYSTVEEFDTNGMRIERKGFVDGDLANNGYVRYKNSQSGVSPRSIPGQRGGAFVASSYEHDEEGFEREEEENRIMMHNKRYRKFETAAEEISEPLLYGPENADVTIISWGSTKGPVLDAMKLLESDSIRTNFLHVVFMSPFPKEKLAQIVKGSKKTIVVENNKTSQLSSLIKEYIGLNVKHKLLKYDGRPFSPEDISAGIKKILSSKQNVLEIWGHS